MKQVCLILLSLFVFSLPGHAALRSPADREAAPRPSRTTELTYHRIWGGFSKRILTPPRFRKPRLNPDDRYNVTAPGTFAFVCSVFSLLCFAALGVTAFPFFVIPAMIFAVAAAVFGAIGFKRHKPGFAITGLTLGILEIVAGFIVLAMVL